MGDSYYFEISLVTGANNNKLTHIGSRTWGRSTDACKTRWRKCSSAYFRGRDVLPGRQQRGRSGRHRNATALFGSQAIERLSGCDDVRIDVSTHWPARGQDKNNAHATDKRSIRGGRAGERATGDGRDDRPGDESGGTQRNVRRCL